LKGLAEVVTVSVDEPEDLQKINHLLGGTFTLLTDPGLRVIRAYHMEHKMGGATVGNMGYVIIDGRGVVRKMQVDPLFGRHAEAILGSLRELK
jgi:peroxiredoxin